MGLGTKQRIVNRDLSGKSSASAGAEAKGALALDPGIGISAATRVFLSQQLVDLTVSCIRKTRLILMQGDRSASILLVTDGAGRIAMKQAFHAF